MTTLAITGVGVRTPVGPGVRETLLSVRAKFNVFQESFVVDRTGERLVVSGIPPLRPGVGEDARLLGLGLPALSEALEEVVVTWPPRHRVGLVLVTPGPGERPGRWRFSEKVVASLAQALPRDRRTPSPWLVPGGHTGWAEALEHAARWLRDGTVDACVLGAVDTLCTPGTLEYLDGHHRVRNAFQEEGLVPGEAAAFLVLEPMRRGAPSLARLASWAQAARLPTETQPLPGAILTRAVRECLRRAALREATPSWLLSDMGGAKDEALEVVFARFRALPGQASEALLLHPAESLGDVGAATGPLLLALATLGLRNGTRGPMLMTTRRPGMGAAALVQSPRS